MADLVINPDNVKAGSSVGVAIEVVEVAQNVSAGDVLYRSGRFYYKAECDDDTDAGDVKAGKEGLALALNSGLSGQQIIVIKTGEIVVGPVVTLGKIYLLSSNPGKIMPVEDFPGLLTRPRLVILGYGVSETNIRLSLQHTGVRLP